MCNIGRISQRFLPIRRPSMISGNERTVKSFKSSLMLMGLRNISENNLSRDVVTIQQPSCINMMKKELDCEHFKKLFNAFSRRGNPSIG